MRRTALRDTDARRRPDRRGAEGRHVLRLGEPRSRGVRTDRRTFDLARRRTSTSLLAAADPTSVWERTSPASRSTLCCVNCSHGCRRAPAGETEWLPSTSSPDRSTSRSPSDDRRAVTTTGARAYRHRRRSATQLVMSENLRMLGKYSAAMEAGDTDAVFEFWSRRLRQPRHRTGEPGARRHRRPRRRAGVVEAGRAAFPDMTFTVNLLIEQDDLVVSNWTVKGTHTGTAVLRRRAVGRAGRDQRHRDPAHPRRPDRRALGRPALPGGPRTDPGADFPLHRDPRASARVRTTRRRRCRGPSAGQRRCRPSDLLAARPVGRRPRRPGTRVGISSRTRGRQRWPEPRALPEQLLNERVNGEWSFSETLRHLVMVTDAWLRRGVLQVEHPFHPYGVTPHFIPNPSEMGIDVDARARPSTKCSQSARSVSRRFTSSSTRSMPKDLKSQAGDGPFTRLGALQVIVFEEWAHHEFATP